MPSPSGFDVINVCTPNGLHGEHIAERPARKHVVIEKPMALTVAECEDHLQPALPGKCSASRRIATSLRLGSRNWLIWARSGRIFMVLIELLLEPRQPLLHRKELERQYLTLTAGRSLPSFTFHIDIMWPGCLAISRRSGGTIRRFYAREPHRLLRIPNRTSVSSTAVWVVSTSDLGLGQNLESSITIIGEKGSVKIGGQYMNEAGTLSYRRLHHAGITTGKALPMITEPIRVLPPINHCHRKTLSTPLKGCTSATTNALEGLESGRHHRAHLRFAQTTKTQSLNTFRNFPEEASIWFRNYQERKTCHSGTRLCRALIALSSPKRFKVIGFDINEARLDKMRNSIDPSGELDTEVSMDVEIEFTSSIDKFREASFFNRNGTNAD